jgi:flagellar biosynthesis protein
VELARASGVAIHEDAGLAQALAALDLGTEIPEELYRAVAEVLAFVYRLNRAA